MNEYEITIHTQECQGALNRLVKRRSTTHIEACVVVEIPMVVATTRAFEQVADRHNGTARYIGPMRTMYNIHMAELTERYALTHFKTVVGR